MVALKNNYPCADYLNAGTIKDSKRIQNRIYPMKLFLANARSMFDFSISFKVVYPETI